MVDVGLSSRGPITIPGQIAIVERCPRLAFSTSRSASRFVRVYGDSTRWRFHAANSSAGSAGVPAARVYRVDV